MIINYANFTDKTNTVIFRVLSMATGDKWGDNIFMIPTGICDESEHCKKGAHYKQYIFSISKRGTLSIILADIYNPRKSQQFALLICTYVLTKVGKGYYENKRRQT